MKKQLKLLLQYLVPQRLLSELMGKIAQCNHERYKNWMIKRFIRKYNVDMQDVLIQNLDEFPNFNSFFTRQLKPDARPITQGSHEIACPVDGFVSQVGKINDKTLFQAKGFYYHLPNLLANDPLAEAFYHGAFATFYLSPRDYHRVHMPFAGKLFKTIYIPGKLFSVNQEAVDTIPELFSRNERMVCFFETEIGVMSVILVGAMLVSGIKMTYNNTLIRHSKITTQHFTTPLTYEKGDELGLFEMGSTAIILFGKDKINWDKALEPQKCVKMGINIGTIA